MESPTDAQLFFSNLVTKFGAYEYIPATIDILLNSFHVYILSHRQMRTSSMTTILIGIALADMIFPVIAIKKQLRIWVLGAGLCTPPEGLIETNINWLLYSIRDDFRRCSTWLGLSLACVRTISVRNSMNHSYKYISKPSFGYKINVSVVLASTLLSIFYYLRFQIVDTGALWTPPPGQARQSRYQEVRLLIHVFFLAIMSATTFAYYVFQAIYSSELGVGDVVLIDNSSSELQGLRALRLWYPLVSGNMSFVNPVMLLMLNRDIQKCLGNVCSGKSIDIHRTSSILAMNRTAT
uniref:G_PROTEIN_RECEP_F1_2 domain-containing protein n=1 Tax=Caenorhabditis tropicalis TaxID=1561998 RepID=A0A1I7UTY9_9PELO